MNINIKNSQPKSAPSQISKRKQDHIAVCKSGSSHAIESKTSLGFDSLQFVHTALPEISCAQISTETDFLGKASRLPLFISCMTGGTEEGYLANKELAAAAERMRVPIGLGSIRVLFDHPERIRDFALRSIAPHAQIIGNLGAQQLKEIPIKAIKELLAKLELDALAIHLNPGQELFQKGGDTDFTGLKSAIGMAVEKLAIPIIVKETGFGVRPSHVAELLDMGVSFVDIAGAGGTNWILVEHCADGGQDLAAMEFKDWGIPTAALLDAVAKFRGKILASGGLRCGMDLAKSIALGASLGGMALPFIRAALDGGNGAVCEMIERFEKVLRAVMLLTGCKTISELRGVPLLRTLEFEHYVQSLKSTDLSHERDY